MGIITCIKITRRHVLPPKEALEFLTKVVGRLGAFYKVFDKNGRLLKKDPQPKGNQAIGYKMTPCNNLVQAGKEKLQRWSPIWKTK
jgi:hypothetical protein